MPRSLRIQTDPQTKKGSTHKLAENKNAKASKANTTVLLSSTNTVHEFVEL
jgi:hypothetical protein